MTKDMKVAYLLSTFPQLTQTFVTREIYWIRQQNIQPDIFSLYKPKTIPAEAQARELAVNVHYSSYISWDIIKSLVFYSFRSPIRLARALIKVIRHSAREPRVLVRALANFPKSVYFARQMQKLRIEHIHAHFITQAAFAANTAAELQGISFTLTGHAVDIFSRVSQDISNQLEDASGIVTISSFHRDYIENLCPAIGNDRIEVVYCGLETERFQPTPPQIETSKTLRILSIGRLIEKKGFEYLIDACKTLAESNLLYQCQIVGDGPLSAALQDRINHYGLQDRITLLGALQQDRVLELYHQSDIFALACVVADDGNRDGLPVVLVEAMSCGLPVVTTPVTGITDLVEHDKTGLLVPERDIASLAGALANLIIDKDLRARLGQNARQKILNDFQIQRTTAKLAAFFRKIASTQATNN